MLIPGSLDYGSVLVDILYKGTNYKVKIYPRMVHTIKSFNSRLQGEILSTIYGVRRRGHACLQMIQHLGHVPREEIGGYRLEVTVQARSLAAARRMVDRTPFLDINFWRCPQEQGTQAYKLDIKVTTKAALLANANWMYSRAVDKGVFKGGNAEKVTIVHLQGTADVLASLGWNAGRRDPTRSLSTTAWWTGTGGTVDIGDTIKDRTLVHLNQKFRGRKGWEALLSILRKKSKLGYIPCQRAMRGGKHSYQVHGWTPLRLRCGLKSCHHGLNEGQSMRWCAELVDRGHVSRTDVGMSLPEVHRVSGLLTLSTNRWTDSMTEDCYCPPYSKSQPTQKHTQRSLNQPSPPTQVYTCVLPYQLDQRRW